MAKQQQPASKSKTADGEIKSGAETPVRSALSGLVLLALVLAVSGLLLQAWQWVRDDKGELTSAVNNLQAYRKAQQASGQTIRTEIDSLSGRLDQLESRQAQPDPPDYSTAISELRQETARLARQSGALQSRLAEQSAMARGNDRHLARAEVAYLLKLGNERLQLFGDRQAALVTLRLAERQLSAMDDPLMLFIRRQLQQDIRAVSGIEFTDPLIILSAIQNLEDSMPEWRLKQVAVEPEVRPDANGSGLWGRFKQSMGSLVTIRKRNEPMLTLAEIDWLQERIRTQFQVARIASLNGNQQLFYSALQTVLQWHAEHYQPDDDTYAEVRRSLQKLISTILKPQLPDITRALREMQYLGSPLEPGTEQRHPSATEDAANEPETLQNSG